MHMRYKVPALLLLAALFAAAPPVAPSHAASGPEISANVNATLDRFFRETPYGRDLANRALAVLVFPTIIKAGFGIGGEYGEGELQIRGQHAGYYNIASASFGFQLGAQARTVIIMFMTDGALAQFQRTDGFKVGVDGSVAVIAIGAGGAIDTNSVTRPVIGFIFDQKGLMYNLTLEGSKISRIAR
jgi:lipid-binding SYLF domain-containing protein